MTDPHFDHSHLDAKYFIDPYVYNCPYCKRRNVKYSLVHDTQFNWSTKKVCYVWFINCSDCEGRSMHLSFEDIERKYESGSGAGEFRKDIDIDSKIFYSVPTSSFAIDDRIPPVIRELITEAEGCLKMNFLTGASACMRKAIYELIVKEKCEGKDYESKIKALKTKHPQIDPSLIDVLAHIQDMTSDKIHEQSWDEWDSPNLKLIIETLKAVLYEIYVEPEVRKGRVSLITQLKEAVIKGKKGDKPTEEKPTA
jgi:hypothetical protein